ncbi:hypothetical protein, partial [Chryseobacterium sp. HMWF001]|uniref:hypothetical protein n=1 Tax=Chryseobacterium sp. HMWF001 TaxID=2056839 RepID=UPI000D4946C6
FYRIGRILFLWILALVIWNYSIIYGVIVKSKLYPVTVLVFCYMLSIVYLLELSKILVIDKNTETIRVRENIFCQTKIFHLKDLLQIQKSESTTNFIPILATAYLIFCNHKAAVLDRRYFATIGSLSSIIIETEKIINYKK